ncbi:MAG TPA: hypothetical protein VLV29_09160 [Steroidobacteraceae bacterium]|nr:hypothetical protein [Steroidobacteraceae bacterium]
MARAQTPALAPPFTDVHTIASASTAVPVEEQFDIANAGTYQVTLTDLGALETPAAPLAAVKLAITKGTQLVGTPLIGPGTLQFTATSPGTYVIRVVGMPGVQPGSGPIGLEVGNPAALYTFSDNLALPGAALPNGEAVINDTFTLSAPSGSYTLTMQDFMLPDALTLATLILIPEGAAQPLAILPDPGSQATQVSVNLTQGVTYRLLAVALPGASGAGLLGASVTSGSTVIRGSVVPVGVTQFVKTVALGAGAYTGRLTDLAYPNPLTQLAGVITLSGQLVATLAPGTIQNFNAVAGTYQVFVAAAPAAASPAAGSYSVLVQPSSGAPSLSTARVVSAPGSAAQAYSFDTQVGGAGSYVVNLANFSFPVSLTSLRLATVQGGALLSTPLANAGTMNITAAAGPLTLLVLAQADPVQGGVFDVNLTPKGSTNLLFDATQGVVGNTLTFLARKITLDSSGTYLLNLTDVGFPADFANIAALISQGSSSVGTIYGSNQLAITGKPGDYFVSLIAQPANADQAGTYALSMALAPVPTVTLTPSATQVASGATVTLTWTSTDATSCTASDGWSGSQAVNGSAVSSALTSTTNFTLTCDGAGGSQAKTVTVTVTGPSGGGGGGAIDFWLLGLIAGLAASRQRRRAH